MLGIGLCLSVADCKKQPGRFREAEPGYDSAGHEPSYPPAGRALDRRKQLSFPAGPHW